MSSRSEYLEHHGIKGMKWGVRKQRQRGNRSSGNSSSQKREVTSKKKATSKKSNNERTLLRGATWVGSAACMAFGLDNVYQSLSGCGINIPQYVAGLGGVAVSSMAMSYLLATKDDTK